MIHTAEYVKSRLSYDPETGEVRWLRCRKSTQIGQIAGSTWGGYRTIVLDRKMYPLHRVVWLIMTGEWPQSLIDHRNLDGLDNRWCNLREATKSQNSQNTKIRRDNKSGYKGVFFVPQRGMWRADIRLPHVRKHLGFFDDPAEAHEAYAKAAAENYGEYGRVS